MSTRVTVKDLESIVARINRITNNPLSAYTMESPGKYVAQVGNYHLSQAYGGVSLHQMVNTSGGVRDVLNCGHVAKKDLQRMMFSYIAGLQENQ